MFCDDLFPEHHVSIHTFGSYFCNFIIIKLNETITFGSVGFLAPMQFDTKDITKLRKVLFDTIFNPTIRESADVYDRRLFISKSKYISFIFFDFETGALVLRSGSLLGTFCLRGLFLCNSDFANLLVRELDRWTGFWWGCLFYHIIFLYYNINCDCLS